MGKTAIIQAFAKAIGLPFERLNVGGLQDSTALTGSASQWIGSMPSIFIQFFKRSGASNGVFLFDEVDKLSFSHGGLEVQNALLHVTDFTQNNQFKDAYLPEVTHNLSGMWFFFALNSSKNINPVLRDRLCILKVPGYGKEDLKVIARKYLLPKALRENSLPDSSITITDRACEVLINEFAGKEIEREGRKPVNHERGVRTLDSAIYTLIKRLSLIKVNNNDQGPLKLRHTIGKGLSFSLPFEVKEVHIYRILDKPEEDVIPDIYS